MQEVERGKGMSCGWVKRGVNVRFVSRLMLDKGGLKV